ncbi:hypothetical protein DFH94DRAFT_684303 [Russula ochroleuca]|uniref:Uncharacterized protein n=1 Tax=Russula ochroleuca TaxID=152965 RepID=A0A9P5MQH5_9AGAM|nr:hypothetical protein DFH94DRAFT_684303 [Russula ochroleuca]
MTTGVLTGCTLGGSDAELADHSRTTLDEHQILALLAAQHNASDYEFKSPPVLSAAVDATVLDMFHSEEAICNHFRSGYNIVSVAFVPPSDDNILLEFRQTTRRIIRCVNSPYMKGSTPDVMESEESTICQAGINEAMYDKSGTELSKRT